MNADTRPLHSTPGVYACMRPEKPIRWFDGRCRPCVVAAFACIMRGDNKIYAFRDYANNVSYRKPLSFFVRMAEERYGHGLPIARLPQE